MLVFVRDEEEGYWWSNCGVNSEFKIGRIFINIVGIELWVLLTVVWFAATRVWICVVLHGYCTLILLDIGKPFFFWIG